jgi:preprotein translocase subunit SecD
MSAMRKSVRKPFFQTGLAVLLALALSGCDVAALLEKPRRVVIVEANATEMAALAQSGLSMDVALTNSLPVLRRRLELVASGPVAVERDGPNRVRVVMSDAAILRDAARLATLLKAGGRLEFRKVDISADPVALNSGQIPPGSEILPAPNGTGLLAVIIGGGFKGSHVSGATQGFDSTSNQPVVSIRFDDTGARQFARLTSQSVGRPIAIVLDGRVVMAPIVNEPVSGGMVQISGGFTVESAQQTATLISAGYLPVSFTVIENKAAPRD